MIRIFRHHISSTYLGLIAIESSLFFAAMYFGSKVRFLTIESWYTEHDITLASIIFAIILSLSCSVVGLYRRSLSWEDYNLLRRMCVSFFIAFLIVTQIYYSFPEFLIARSVLGYALLFGFFGMVISRYLFYKFANIERLKRRVLVIGGGEKAHALTSLNDSFIHKSFKIVGFFVLPNEHLVIDNDQIIYANKNLPEICEELNIDEIVIALDDKRLKLPIDQLLDCKMLGTTIMDIIVFYEREKGIISLNDLYPSWFIYSDGFAHGDFKAAGKRGFDILASLLLLSVAWPFMIITALAIMLEAGPKGSVIYRQQRVGENNKNFDVLKFRSMRIDAEKNGAQWAKQNDNRITRVGGFIRKCRIDELPQIFNVLKGEMSFVGPRPERPEFVHGFEQRIPYYRERHRVKPGITGWAQLCYPYGANEYDTIQKLQYDLYYVKNYSLFLDFSIMLNTVEIILWGKGAR